jgi:hypothetical protein
VCMLVRACVCVCVLDEDAICFQVILGFAVLFTVRVERMEEMTV